MVGTEQTIGIALVSALLGGPVWSFLSQWLNLGAAKRKDSYARIERDVEKLRAELAQCEERHGILEARLRAVENKNASYFALWIKDRNGRIAWLNDKAFLTIFAPLGYGRDELDGKTFRDLLDPVAADEIDLLDRAALAHPGATQSLLVQLHPDLPFMVVIKVAAVSAGGDVQYEGCAYCPSDPDIRTGMQVARQVRQRSLSAARVLDDDAE